MKFVKGLDYDFVGGNIFYGVYFVKSSSLGIRKGFHLGWDMAFGKGKFEVGKFPFADFDEELQILLNRLRTHSLNCSREMKALNIDEDSAYLKFKFNRGAKKKYG